MKKVLLPTNFSEASQKALLYARELFAETATEFYLFHAYDLVPDSVSGTNFQMVDAEWVARRKLQNILAELTPQPIPDYQSYHLLIAPGSPVEAIEELMERTCFDYVVLGAGHADGLSRLETLATALIRRSKAHVLVVPPTTIIRPIQEVVLAADMHTLAEPASLHPLKELIMAKDVHLTALSVIDNQTPLPVGPDFKRFHDQIALVFDTFETGPYLLLDENAEHGIETYLASHSVDLLVTVPRRKSLMEAIWNRSLTCRLATDTPVPLLALYEPASVQQERLVGETG